MKFHESGENTMSFIDFFLTELDPSSPFSTIVEKQRPDSHNLYTRLRNAGNLLSLV